MYECDLCGKEFLTKQAKYGHASMCPEKTDRVVPDEWAPPNHGRWGDDPDPDASQ